MEKHEKYVSPQHRPNRADGRTRIRRVVATQEVEGGASSESSKLARSASNLDVSTSTEGTSHANRSSGPAQWPGCAPRVNARKREHSNSDDTSSSNGDENGDADGDDDGVGQAKKSKPGARTKFTEEQIRPLTSWLLDHLARPYPSRDEKDNLAKETGLNVMQVCYWFTNARRRSYSPLLEEENARRVKQGLKPIVRDPDQWARPLADRPPVPSPAPTVNYAPRNGIASSTPRMAMDLWRPATSYPIPTVDNDPTARRKTNNRSTSSVSDLHQQDGNATRHSGSSTSGHSVWPAMVGDAAQPTISNGYYPNFAPLQPSCMMNPTIFTHSGMALTSTAPTSLQIATVSTIPFGQGSVVSQLPLHPGMALTSTAPTSLQIAAVSPTTPIGGSVVSQLPVPVHPLSFGSFASSNGHSLVSPTQSLAFATPQGTVVHQQAGNMQQPGPQGQPATGPSSNAPSAMAAHNLLPTPVMAQVPINPGNLYLQGSMIPGPVAPQYGNAGFSHMAGPQYGYRQELVRPVILTMQNAAQTESSEGSEQDQAS